MQIWTQLGRYEGGLRPRYCLKEKLHGGQRSRQTCRRRGKAQLVFAWLRRNMEFSFHKLQENHYFSSTCKAADKTQSKDHIQIKYICRCVRCDPSLTHQKTQEEKMSPISGLHGESKHDNTSPLVHQPSLVQVPVPRSSR